MDGPIRVTGVKYPKRRKQNPSISRQVRRTWPLRLGSLLWIPVVAGMAWFIHANGTPHLRYQYTYTGGMGSSASSRFYLDCFYIGLHSRRVTPKNGHCPLFLFIRPSSWR